MKTIGLDIGTTTICAVVADTGAESLRFSRTLPNTSALPGGAQGEKWQEPQVIVDICRSLLEECTAAHPDAEGVGISGQMHGVVYLNSEGRPVGPLAIWQDGRGDVRVPGREISYAQELSRLTGYPMATGYGVTTAYADAKNGRIPREARMDLYHRGLPGHGADRKKNAPCPYFTGRRYGLCKSGKRGF